MRGLFIDEFLDEADHTGMVRFVSSPRTSVGPSFPVTCAPVFDRKESTGLEVMIKQVPETRTGRRSDMRCVVDHDVEAIGRHLGGDLRQKRGVFLAPLVNPQTIIVLLSRLRLHVETGNGPVRKVISPQPQGSPGPNAQLEQLDRLVDQRFEDAIVDVQVVVGNFVRVVFAKIELLAAAPHFSYPPGFRPVIRSISPASTLMFRR